MAIDRQGGKPPHRDVRKGRQRLQPDKPAPDPTLAELRRRSFWVWAHCVDENCYRSVPVTLAWTLIRWGPGASAKHLRESLRCACGHRGARLMLPGADGEGGVRPFPFDRQGLMATTPRR